MTVFEDGTEIELVDVPVASAWSDGAGGLLFSHHWLSEKAGIWRIPTGASEPVAAIPGYSGTYSVVELDGRTAIVRYDDYESRRCEAGSIGAYDLETGALRDEFVVCSGEGDAGWFPYSYGDGLFAGVRWDHLGSCVTASGIMFWDRAGTAADVPTNPHPLHDWDTQVPTWVPCELDARLSPDGSLLAFRYRPDNKWPCPEYDDVPYEEWLEESLTIPGLVVVLDMETGAEVFRTQSEAEERLADFDGRFIALTTADRRWDVPMEQLETVETSTIVDITGRNWDHIVDGRVRFISSGS